MGVGGIYISILAAGPQSPVAFDENGWQGRWIFAISPACRRQRRIADRRRTLLQPFQPQKEAL